MAITLTPSSCVHQSSPPPAAVQVRLSDLVFQNESRVLEFTGFGKITITAHNLSPDAFVQLGLMAAYYQLFGQIVSVYEPVRIRVPLPTLGSI